MHRQACLFRYAGVEVGAAALDVYAGFGRELGDAFAFLAGQSSELLVYREGECYTSGLQFECYGFGRHGLRLAWWSDCRMCIWQLNSWWAVVGGSRF